MVIQHLKQIGKVKRLDKWVPQELTTNQGKCRFEVSSSLFLYNNTREHFSIWLWCVTKWILYHNWWWPAQWLDREEAPKYFQKPNWHQKKKRLWSLFGSLLPFWSITTFWILAKPLHLRSMLSSSMRCTETARLAAGIGPQKGPNSSPWQCLTTHHTTNTSKL